MPFVTIIANKKTPKRMGTLTLDAVVSESFDYQRTVTSYPVEQGCPISDHIRQEPTRITIEAIITNSPIVEQKISEVFIRLVADGRITTLEETSVDRVSGGFQRLMEMLGESDNLDSYPQVELVEVVTSLKVYSDLALTSVNISKTEASDSLKFTATFQRVRLAKLRTAIISMTNPATPTAAGVAGAVDDKNNVKDQVAGGVAKGRATSHAYDLANSDIGGKVATQVDTYMTGLLR